MLDIHWKCILLKRSLARFVVYHKTVCDIQAETFFSRLLIIPPYRAINTLLADGSITGSFLARIRRLSSHNCLEFPRKGPRFSIRHFIRHTAVGSALSILSRFVTSTSTMLRASSDGRGRRRGGEAEEKRWKEEATLRSPFPFPA